MFKKIFYLLCLLSLSNCSAPGTAFLGPIFTGAKTGSIYQTGFSYGTSHVIKKETGQSTTEHLSKMLEQKKKKKTIDEEFVLLVKNQIKKARQKLKVKKN